MLFGEKATGSSGQENFFACQKKHRQPNNPVKLPSGVKSTAEKHPQKVQKNDQQ